MRPSSTSTSRLVAWLAGLATVLVAAPLLVWAAFSAHEARCDDAEAFWTGDLPTGPGRVDGVILGSSQMGLDIDVYALAAATGHPWARVARHAVEQSSIPRTYPRMLASSAADPGLAHLVVEVSPLLYDTVGCARPELPGLPLRVGWLPAAREMLGEDAELAPEVAMGWLPHRAIMTSGRRHDIIEHLKRPGHALRLLADFPRIFAGVSPPARWTGEPPPEITLERVQKRRQFLLGAPLESWRPEVSAMCMGVLEKTIAGANARRTVLLLPPMRGIMRDAIPEGYRAAFRAEVQRVAGTHRGVLVYDATGLFENKENTAFLDFDHLSEAGAAEFTPWLAKVIRFADARSEDSWDPDADLPVEAVEGAGDGKSLDAEPSRR